MKKKIKIKILLVAVLIFFVILLIRHFSSLLLISHQRESPPAEFPSDLTPMEITIEISNGKIEPKVFKVKSGQGVKLRIISMEGRHSIVFEDEELAWVGGEFTEPGQTLAITFTAPREKGEYRLFCKEPGHREAGEEAVMMVE